MSVNNSENVCIFHKNCVDGMASAWVAHKFFEGDIVLIAAEYHKRKELISVIGEGPNGPIYEVDERLLGKDIYITDFSFTREETIELQRVANKVIVLDHHDTAVRNLQGLYDVDTTKCGATLTWEYFFGVKDLPEAFKLIQDNDLGVWSDERTLPWIMAVQGSKLSIENFDLFMSMDVKDVVELGLPVFRYHMKQVNTIKKEARNFNLDEFKGVIVNASSYLRNELGVALSKDHDFAAIYSDRADVRVYSLRGRDKRIPLDKIAERFGGGGHANAAAFSISLNDPRMNTAHYLLRSVRPSDNEGEKEYASMVRDFRVGEK